jgi:pimeloyl-ACP methyl ester carboxylesterase
MIVSILFIVAIFSAKGILGLSLLVLTAALIVLMSGISFKVILKSLKPIVFVLLFTVILNIFLTKSTAEEPLFEFYFISVYRDGIWRAVYMALRVIILIVGSSVLISYTTSPIMLTDAIESLLNPLKKIKVPVIFYHGETDDFVPCWMSRANYEACAARKAIVTMPGAGHGLCYPVDRDRYVKTLAEFFGPEASWQEE